MILSILYFVIILGVIVFVHEFGHFFFAKLFGIYVHEFAIGMGPKIFSWKGKNKETVYSLRAIPIGGFCSLAGEGAEEDKKLPKDRLLGSKPIWQRFLVMFFGAGNNFILALVTLIFLGLIMGNSISTTTISRVVENSAAESVGLKAGDKIISVNGENVYEYSLGAYLSISHENNVIKVLRDGKEEEFVVTPQKIEEDGKTKYVYGLEFEHTIKRGFFEAIKYGFKEFGNITKQMVLSFKLLFKGSVGVNQLSGPVGIYSIVDEARKEAKDFIFNFLHLLALLSLNVGFVNLIPFPAFDGGRIIFLIIEKIKGSPVKSETENMIHSIGFFILLALIIYITVNDIIRLV